MRDRDPFKVDFDPATVQKTFVKVALLNMFGFLFVATVIFGGIYFLIQSFR